MTKLVVVSVEDNDADFHIIEMALHECLSNLRMLRAVDGEMAIKLLDEFGLSSAQPLPVLVLLDRNLPRRDGFEVLTHLHATQLTARIPVVMLTSTVTPSDRQRALDLGARDVITKPTDLDELIKRLKLVCDKQLQKTT